MMKQFLLFCRWVYSMCVCPRAPPPAHRLNQEHGSYKQLIEIFIIEKALAGNCRISAVGYGRSTTQTIINRKQVSLRLWKIGQIQETHTSWF